VVKIGGETEFSDVTDKPGLSGMAGLSDVAGHFDVAEPDAVGLCGTAEFLGSYDTSKALGSKGTIPALLNPEQMFSYDTAFEKR